MGAGAGAAGFGAGFAKGLAGQLHENVLLKREDERRAQEKRDQMNLAIFPKLFEESGGDFAAMEPWLQTAFPDTFGMAGKKAKAPKAGESSPLDMISRVFSHFRTRLPGAGSGNLGTGTGTGTGTNAGDPTGVTNPTAVMDTGYGRTLPSGTTTDALSPILAAAPAQAGGQASTAAASPMLPAPQASAVIPNTGIPTTVQPPPGDAAGAPPVRKTFMGVPLLTPEEKADRAALPAAAQIQAKVRLARKMFADGTAKSMEEAMDYVGLYNMHAANGGSRGTVRTLPGVDANGKRVQAVWDPATRTHTYAPGEVDKDGNDISGQIIKGFVQMATGVNFGQDREALAKSMYNKSFRELDPSESQVVIAAETALQGKEAGARTTATKEAEFHAPITVPQAAASGAVVGTNSAAYSGQTVGSEAEIKQRRSLEDLKVTLNRVVQPQPRTDQAGVQGKLMSNSLLDILPTEKALAGQIPGAAIFAKRNSNFASGLTDENGKALSNREAMARLDSNISSMINVLAIARGQRGTQTEKDADRAYQSLVNLQGNLTSPLKGDTRESALARITEAQRIIDQMIAATPGRPVPNAAGGASAPAAAAAGGPNPTNPTAPYKDANGVWHIPQPAK